MNPESFKTLRMWPRVGNLVRLSRPLNGDEGTFYLCDERDYDEFDVLVDGKGHYCHRHEFDMVSK